MSCHSLAQRGAAPVPQVSVACFNMLCQSFCVPRRYPFCAPEALEWPHRWPRLQRALAGFGADIVALQEVRCGLIQPQHLPRQMREPGAAAPSRWPVGAQRAQQPGAARLPCCVHAQVTVALWPEVESFMAGLGYSGVLQRFSLGEGAPPYSSATFFLSAKFGLAWHEERSRALLLGLECLGPGLDSQVALSLRAAAVRLELDAPPPLPMCARALVCPQVLCVANVHLESSPHRPHDRVSQLRSALAHLRTRQEAAGQDPASSLVLVCGDFNSKANEAPCTFLREGRLVAGFRDPYYPLVPATRNTVEHPVRLRVWILQLGIGCCALRVCVSGGGGLLPFLSLQYLRHVLRVAPPGPTRTCP